MKKIVYIFIDICLLLASFIYLLFKPIIRRKPWEESQKIIDDKHDGKTLTLSRE